MDEDPTLVASNKWLDLLKKKKRHGVFQLCMTGEKLFCDCMIAEEFIKEFDVLLSSEIFFITASVQL